MAPLIAFQLWDVAGWLGQGFFVARMLHQWVLSERAGRSLLPAAFWWYSVAGTALLIIYQLHRRDPVFLVGFLVNGAIYVRNLVLTYRPRAQPDRRGRAPWLAPLLGMLAFAACLAVTAGGARQLVSFEANAVWLVFGFLAQALWSSRFVIQWISSERAGRSVLPAAFFRVSILGALGLFAYAVHRLDWVMMAAFVLNPIPYVRNLVLIRREAAAREAEALEGRTGRSPRAS